MVRPLYQIGALAITRPNLICRYLRYLQSEYIICLFSHNTITISFRFLVFTITNHEKQGELMVRSLYQIGAVEIFKA